MLHRPRRPAVASAFRSLARNSARGISRAPKRRRCSVSTWQSTSSNPRPRIHSTAVTKAAFVTAVAWMRDRGFELVDCQVDTEHLRRFGAREIPRAEFLARLGNALATAGRRGPWSIDDARPRE